MWHHLRLMSGRSWQWAMQAEVCAGKGGDSVDTPWICHICGKASRSNALTCEVCFRTTCAVHLRRSSLYNKESGLYEFISVCTECGLAEMLK